MWYCKSCGQHNEDAFESCMLCGGTEREAVVVTETPTVVIPSAEERERKPVPRDTTLRPAGRAPSFATPTRDTDLRRPTSSTGSTGTTTRTTSTTPTRTTSTASTHTTSTPTRTTSTASSGRGTTTSTATRRARRERTPSDIFKWWKIPTSLFIVTLFASCIFSTHNPFNNSVNGMRFIFSFVLVSLLLLAYCFTMRGGRARGLTFILQLFSSIVSFLIMVNREELASLYFLIYVTLIVTKIITIVRYFKNGYRGRAITLIILSVVDLYVCLACFFIDDGVLKLFSKM